MGATTQARDQIVQEAIREISHIATLPEITLKIIQLVEDPKSTAQDLHEVIANDPALCSRILKVVNSSFYGLPGQIASINRGIVMLGLNAVKNIAIAASLAKLFRSGRLTDNFDAKELWEHSIVTAVAAKIISDDLKFGLADEAFLAGLMHDIGIIVELQYDRNKLVEVLEQLGADAEGVPAVDSLEVEERVFGADHQAFGAALCERWKFPKSLVYVTGHHHDPLSAPADNRVLPALVHVAERLVAETKGTFRLDLVSTRISTDVLDALGTTPETIAKLREQLPERLEGTETMLS